MMPAMPTDTQDAPPSSPPASVVEPGVDPFQQLHKMSTTAGVGAGDYVAINGTAVAAVLVGILSATVLFGLSALLVLPLIGVVLAVVAWVQIGRSNGTQAGRGLAVLAMLLSLGLGGYQGSRAISAAVRAARAEGAVVRLIRDFGQDIVHERYAQAYARCDATFRERVPPTMFEGAWRGVRDSKVLGTLAGIDWNGRLVFEVDPLTAEPAASGMVLVQFARSKEPGRTDMFFRQVNGTWQVDNVPQMFPPVAANGSTPATPGRPGRQSMESATPESSGPMGPPKPSNNR